MSKVQKCACGGDPKIKSISTWKAKADGFEIIGHKNEEHWCCIDRMSCRDEWDAEQLAVNKSIHKQLVAIRKDVNKNHNNGSTQIFYELVTEIQHI